MIDEEGLYNSVQFTPHLLWNPNAMEHLGNNKAVDRLDFYLPFYRYLGKSNLYRSYFEEETSVVQRKKGFKSFERKWTSTQIDPFYKEFDHRAIDMFGQFLSDMKKEDIKVVLVVAPFYVEGQDILLNKETNMNVIRKYANDFSLTLLDYSESTLSYKKDYFYNHMHLNSRGAQQFSLELAIALKANQIGN